MRLIRVLGLLLVLTQLGVAASHAGPGAVVLRNSFPLWSIWWNDYDITNVALVSSDPDFDVGLWCEGDPWPDPSVEYKLLSAHDVLNLVNGKENRWLKGPAFTRVYGNFDPPLPLDGSFLNQAWMCRLLNGQEGQLLAQGVAAFKWSEQNFCNQGPGQYTWFLHAVGNLSDVAGVCSSGVAHFDFTFHLALTEGASAVLDPWGNCIVDYADFRKVVIRGPDLRCTGR